MYGHPISTCHSSTQLVAQKPSVTQRSHRNDTSGHACQPPTCAQLLTHLQWSRTAVGAASPMSAPQGVLPVHCRPPGFLRAELRPKLMVWMSRERQPLHAPVHCASPWECTWQLPSHPLVVCHWCHLNLPVWVLRNSCPASALCPGEVTQQGWIPQLCWVKASKGRARTTRTHFSLTPEASRVAGKGLH